MAAVLNSQQTDETDSSIMQTFWMYRLKTSEYVIMLFIFLLRETIDRVKKKDSECDPPHMHIRLLWNTLLIYRTCISS